MPENSGIANEVIVTGMLDAIEPKDKSQKQKRGRFSFRLKLALVMLVLLIVGIFIGSRVIILAEKILDQRTTFSSFGGLFLSDDKRLIGEAEGEVRVLLMGIGGEGHDGGTLTDTMLLATLKLPENREEEARVGLVSLPRDLVAFIPGYDWRKINSAYAFGELNNKNQGARLASETVERVVGKEIPYWAVIDFQGFQAVIDELGGVEVNIETSFTDARYPDGRHGYLPPITFEAGRQRLDGERALQYARSRHGTNNQGSDFARSKRQQELLKAVYEKVSGMNILINFNTINRVLNAAADNFRTNLELHEMKRLYDLAKNLKPEAVSSFALDARSGILCNQVLEENGAYILIPCEGLARYERVRSVIDNQFVAGTLMEERPVIEIQNATSIPELAAATRTFISLPNTEIVVGNYRGEARYLESVIYDNTNGQKSGTLDYLRKKLGVRVAGSVFPFQTTREGVDFVVVIAENLRTKVME